MTTGVHGNRVSRAGKAYDLVTMSMPTAPDQKRKRGNPQWGKPLTPVHVVITEFEAEAARLGLTKDDYVASAALKRWCNHNRNRVYIPEWLLDKWDMEVDSNSGIYLGWMK